MLKGDSLVIEEKRKGGVDGAPCPGEGSEVDRATRIRPKTVCIRMRPLNIHISYCVGINKKDLLETATRRWWIGELATPPPIPRHRRGSAIFSELAGPNFLCTSTTLCVELSVYFCQKCHEWEFGTVEQLILLDKEFCLQKQPIYHTFGFDGPCNS